MKKIVCLIFVIVMFTFAVNPPTSEARGGHWAWWAPWVVVGGAVALSPYYYPPYYYSPYYYYPPPAVVVRSYPPVYYPQPTAAVPPASVERIFIYPRQGQNDQQQARDQYECHSWARNQTQYDPTQPPRDFSEVQLHQMRADYQRAMGACLDGRGYTMK